MNVSGWKDDDKQGRKYKDYFVNAASYSITNYGGIRGNSQELTKELPEQLYHKFDVVFNHTTLEHIYENRIAFANLCKMAEDAVIAVVPWVQETHITDSYGDYWRYSPFAMEQLYEENGFSMVVCSYNKRRNTAVYLFCIGLRNNKMDKYPNFRKIRVTNDDPAGE